MKEKLEEIIKEIEDKLNESEEWTLRQMNKGEARRAQLGAFYENGLLDALKILDKHKNSCEEQ